MTNILYFHNTIRDDESLDSTSTEDEDLVCDPKSLRFDELNSSTINFRPFGKGIPVAIRDDESIVSRETPFISSCSSHQQGEGGILEYSNSKEFCFNELKRTTRKFHNDHILGEGGCGRVFMGWIDENKLTASKPGKGIAVAIKRPNQQSLQGHHEWQAEINYLGRLYHPNLLRLFGYCLHNEERLLVYEFMPRGSLDNHLFKMVSTPLSWSVRMKIALGAAKGLAFLHSAPINVIHRGFITSNILLDKDYNAKLSGFKLARDGPNGDKSHVSTRVMGTYGYAAPEYIATGQLTAKSDVYTFGVILLEMLSGRRAMDSNRPSEERFLVKWAEPYLNHKRKVYHVADSRLEGQYSLEGFQKAANLALICLSMEGISRPNMDEVVKVLGELQNFKDKNHPK